MLIDVRFRRKVTQPFVHASRAQVNIIATRCSSLSSAAFFSPGTGPTRKVSRRPRRPPRPNATKDSTDQRSHRWAATPDATGLKGKKARSILRISRGYPPKCLERLSGKSLRGLWRAGFRYYNSARTGLLCPVSAVRMAIGRVVRDFPDSLSRETVWKVLTGTKPGLTGRH